jgi:hypothetical protein
MAVRHPRWEVSDKRLELVRKKGFFNGYKTSEGKSLSKKMEKVRPGDVVKMVCSDKSVWLGLQKGDSFLITITNVQKFHSWDAMLDRCLELREPPSKSCFVNWRTTRVQPGKCIESVPTIVLLGLESRPTRNAIRCATCHQQP